MHFYYWNIEQIYQLLAHGRWFSPGTPASSTTKTGRHDIAGILLKVALNTKNQNQNQIQSAVILYILHCIALFKNDILFVLQLLCDEILSEFEASDFDDLVSRINFTR